jgi:Nuclear pore assembly and biogenesis
MAYLRSASPTLFTSISDLFSSSATASSSKHSHGTPPWRDYLDTYLLGPLSSLISGASSKSSSGGGGGVDIITAVILLVSIFVFFRVANYVRRIVMWWVFLFVRLAVLYGVLVVGLSVWGRGLDTTLRDIGSFWGYLEGVLRWMGREVGGQMGLGSETGFGAATGGEGRGPRAYNAGRAGRGAYGSGYGYGGGNGWGRGQVPVDTRRGGWV